MKCIACEVAEHRYKREIEQLEARVMELKKELDAVRSMIHAQPIDSFGTGYTHQGEPYSRRDELTYMITQTLIKTPVQSLARIKADALRQFADTFLDKEGRICADHQNIHMNADQIEKDANGDEIQSPGVDKK